MLLCLLLPAFACLPLCIRQGSAELQVVQPEGCVASYLVSARQSSLHLVAAVNAELAPFKRSVTPRIQPPLQALHATCWPRSRISKSGLPSRTPMMGNLEFIIVRAAYLLPRQQALSAQDKDETHALLKEEFVCNESLI